MQHIIALTIVIIILIVYFSWKNHQNDEILCDLYCPLHNNYCFLIQETFASTPSTPSTTSASLTSIKTKPVKSLDDLKKQKQDKLKKYKKVDRRIELVLPSSNVRVIPNDGTKYIITIPTVNHVGNIGNKNGNSKNASLVIPVLDSHNLSDDGIIRMNVDISGNNSSAISVDANVAAITGSVATITVPAESVKQEGATSTISTFWNRKG